VAITLRIDNMDRMDDGGPLEFTAGNRGFDIGRDQHLDWTLPDPNRIISSQHCRVTFENGTYLLHDVSRNGTFVNGAPGRVRSPYRLADGDRLQIGHYLISVSIDGGARAQPQPFEPPTDAYAPPDDGDIWSTGQAAPEAVDRKWFTQEQRRARGQRAPDPLQNFVELPRFAPPAGSETPFGGGGGESPFGGGATPFAGESPFGGGDPFGGGGGESPFGSGSAGPIGAQLRNVPGSQIPERAPGGSLPPDFNRAVPYPQARMPDPGHRGSMPASGMPTGGGGAGFIAAFCAAAGIAPETLAQRSPDELGKELGTIVRIVTEQLSGLLKARAAAKLMTKSANRTMVGPANNNALKFAPSAAEALAIMFERRRSGYLDATASIQEGFEDIKAHEFATYAAMQKALAKLMEDLAPDQIEDKAGGAFGNKKARAWDVYVERWNAKTEHYENGILDLFLEYFRNAYDSAGKR
jgi:type VI secretion system protein ImpI